MWRTVVFLFAVAGAIAAAPPSIAYAVPGSALVSAVAVDASGNVYLTGNTSSSVFPATPGAFQTKYGGGSCIAFPNFGGPTFFPCNDAFVIKLDPTGAVVYATYLGGGGQDNGLAIAVDSAGDVYVAGTTTPSNTTGVNNFPVTSSAAFPAVSKLGSDAFVAKLNPAGSQLLYATYLPGMGWGPPLAMTIDRSGNAYVAGLANPSLVSVPTTSGSFQTASSSSRLTGAVAKLNASGSALVYATYLGGTGSANNSAGDVPTGIAVDPSGNAFVTGFTVSVDFPVTSGAFQTKPPNKIDAAFISKLNAAGSGLIYSTYLGGTGSDSGQAIRLDAQGNAYVLGTTYSTDFPVTAGAFQSVARAPWAYAVSPSRFVSKFSVNGSGLVYSTYLSGASALDVDPTGNAYVAGAAGPGFPVTGGAYQRCFAGGGNDAFSAQFTPNGTLVNGTYLGGSAPDAANAIAVGTDGSVYIAGDTNSTDFPGINPRIQDQNFLVHLLIDDPKKQDSPCMALVLQNAASFVEGPVAPGEIVTLRGAGFGPEMGMGPLFTPGPTANVSTSAGGVRLFFNDIPAPLLYVQAQQINAIVPWELAGQPTAQVHVEYLGSATDTATIRLATSAPGIFLQNFDSQQGAILNDDGTVNSAANPAKTGSVIAIYGTGGGSTNTPGITGAFWPSDSLIRLTLPVSVTVGGLDAPVVYAGSAPALITGFFQINVRVPALLPSAAWYVNVRIGAASSPSQTVTVAVK